MRSAAEWGKLISMLAGSFLATGAWAADLNALQDLKVEQTTDGARVLVEGSRAPTFTVFRLSDPDRLVVDLSSADASAIKGHHNGLGPVSGVVAKQFSDDRASVGRVLVALDHAAQYDVHAQGNEVVIAIASDKPGQPAKAAVAPIPAQEAPKMEAAAQPVAPAAAPTAALATSEDGVTIAESDHREVSHPAHALTAINARGHELSLTSDGALAKYELLELQNPPRLALDVYGVSLKSKVPHAAHLAGVKEIRAGEHPDKVRFVLDLAQAGATHHVQFTAHGLSLAVGDSAPAQLAKAEPVAKPAEVKAEPAKDEEAEAEIDGQKVALAETAPLTVKPQPAAQAKAHPVEVQDIKFSDRHEGGEIALKLSGNAAWKLERPDGQSAMVTLDGASLPKRLERSLDTSALDTPVKMVSAFAVPGDGSRVRLAVSASSPLEAQVAKTDGGLTLKLSAAASAPEQVAVNEKTAPISTEAVTYAVEGQARRAHYTGQRVNFEFKDIDIHNLLRIIGEISRKSIIVADDVSGKVTLRLRNVPWDEALDLILRSKGLGEERVGDVIRIAPLKTLEEEAKLREDRQKSMRNSAPLEVQLIPVNFATASDMQGRVKDVLSERGTVSVDARTNVLIVRDIAANIGKARSLVQALDTQTPEVLIESRIVEANTSYSRQIGVQWGGFAQAAAATGNATGLTFPNSIRVGGGVDPGTAPTTGISSTPNFAVNLPAAVGAGSGGALGFVFGSAGGAVQLNLRLSALENQGAVKTISAPKVTTLDNVTASISQGVSIPFSQVSASGVNTTFIQANLSLQVTPHVTQSGSILMNIKAENNQPDPSNTGANGQPAIQKKEAQTEVLVNDNDTTVIGGIYVRRGATSSSMVPFLGKIPLLGFFFKNNTESESRQELLIFITPRIINRQAIASHL